MKTGDLVKLKESQCAKHAFCSCKPEDDLGMLIEPPTRKSMGWATVLWFNDGFVSHNKDNFEAVKR